jgi:arsenical pump membrane protein
MLRPIFSVLIFLLTLSLVLVKPKNLNDGVAALFGAGLALLTGVIGFHDVVTVAHLVWDATFALIAIVVISTVLDGAGFFRWAALRVAQRAGGSGRAIFLAIILLGALVSALFTNDATVLILTPIVYELLAALGFSPRQMLPYLMACGFVADVASIPLAVSNLTNMIAARQFELSFARYALLMLLPTLATLTATVVVLLLYYRKEIPSGYDRGALPEPTAAIRDPFLFRVGGLVLGCMVIAFFLNSLWHFPVSFVIAAGAVILLLATRRNRVVEPVAVLKGAPWHVILFASGMFLVVFGLAQAGLTQLLAGWLQSLATRGQGALILGTGGLVALLSAVMNNLPAVMVGGLSIQIAGQTPALREVAVLANVIGSDIGPKMTPIGSLATLIWLYFLGRKGLKVSWRDYFKVGLVITPPVLLAALLGLWGAAVLLQ